jgi:hypothetical protein
MPSLPRTHTHRFTGSGLLSRAGSCLAVSREVTFSIALVHWPEDWKDTAGDTVGGKAPSCTWGRLRSECVEHAYPPGQVQVEIPGAQEPQQKGVGEGQLCERGARLPRPAPQLRQAGLHQRRVIRQRVELLSRR